MDRYQMFDALKKYKEKQNNKTELNGMDSFAHAATNYNHYQSNQPGYYAKLDDFWGKGKHRYFYTKAEWDAYNKNKQAAQNAGADRAAKQKEEAAKKTPSQQAQSGREAAIKQAQENEQKRKQEEYLKNAQAAGKKAEEERKAQEEARKEYLKNAQAAGKKAEEERRLREETLRKEREEKRKAYLENLQKNSKKAEEERKNREAEVKKEAEEIKRERDEALKNENYPKWYQEHNKAEINENSEKMRNDPNSILNMSNDVINFTMEYTVPETEEEFWKLVDDYNNGTFQAKLAENDRKIRDIYDKIDENKETEEIDPKTGFRIKNYDLPIEEEIKMVNPGYYYSDEALTDYVLYNMEVGPNGYSNNCYACTQAMALRKKGYDVNPGSDINGIKASGTDPEIGISYDNLWTGDFTEYHNYNNTFKNISKEPVGSYGDFNWSYSDGMQNCGHSIFYEVKADGVHYYDCQNGMEYDEAYILKLSKTTINFETRYKRLDNQEFKAANKMKDSGKISKQNLKNDKGGLADEKK